jgi:large subunit ribosomal protein L6
MSKIGRKPIDIGSVAVEIKGHEVHFKGKKNSGVYVLPGELTVQLEGKSLRIGFEKEGKSRNVIRDSNRVWGLHRALLANELKGAEGEFEKVMQINGLGFKAVLTGNKLLFSLGYTHKIEFSLPPTVSVEIDKTGQRLAIKSPDCELVGLVASKIRMMRPPEPYKGTGIKYEKEVIVRKAGKAKASAA